MTEYIPLEKEKAIVIDIDGVILSSEIILKEIYNFKLYGNDMWNYFQENCNDRRVLLMEDILTLLNCLKSSVYVILSTSRNESCRKGTENRLHEEEFPYDILYMRDIDDDRPSTEVKKDHLDKIRQKYDIIAFIDDDLNNCLMAKKEGILSLRKV